MIERQDIMVTMDWDGTMTKEPSWLTDLGTLIMERSDVLVNVAALYLQRSRLKDDAIEVVKGMYTLGMGIALLTGRFPSLHEFTLQSMKKLGCGSYFSEVFLNPNPELKGWKRQKVGQLISDGYTVFHFENKKDEAEDIASLGPGVFVYLVNNSPHRASLPENLTQVPTLTAGFNNLKAKFTLGLTI